MKTISIGLLLLSILNSPAEILIYKSNKTVTRNGEQATVVEKFGGFLVLDTETRFIVTINTHTVAGVKKFFVSEEFDYYLEQVFGAGKTYTVFNRVIDEDNFTGQDYFKGANVRFLVNGKAIEQPKTWTISTRAFLWPEEGAPTLYESNGTATLDIKQTVQYDTAGLGLDEVVSALRATLLSKQYVEEN
jgi:hypothetical protein